MEKIFTGGKFLYGRTGEKKGLLAAWRRPKQIVTSEFCLSMIRASRLKGTGLLRTYRNYS